LPPFERLSAALPALTHLRLSASRNPDVASLTGLRRLEVRAESINEDDFSDDECCTAVEGLSGLTALEDLRLDDLRSDDDDYDDDDDFGHQRLAQPSDLAPLTALTRLAMARFPPELALLPLAARLRRLELKSFYALTDGPGGTVAAAFAALARGATLLERLVVRVDYETDEERQELPRNLPYGVKLRAPLGADIVWPSLAHLSTSLWAALLLAGCTFPRLSRLVAHMVEGEDGDYNHDDNVPKDQLRAAVAALAAKARDHAALRVIDVGDAVVQDEGALATNAAPPGLRHLSWRVMWLWRRGAVAAPPGEWTRLAASLKRSSCWGPCATLATPSRWPRSHA
jgi:hypothetical protein